MSDRLAGVARNPGLSDKQSHFNNFSINLLICKIIFVYLQRYLRFKIGIFCDVKKKVEQY